MADLGISAVGLPDSANTVLSYVTHTTDNLRKAAVSVHMSILSYKVLPRFTDDDVISYSLK
jgi:hypothetical protein